MQNNRINFQPDYILSIVRIPKDWQPQAVYEVPPICRVISQAPVASFDEAYEDLLRCNRLAMKKGLRKWAIVQMSEADA